MREERIRRTAFTLPLYEVYQVKWIARIMPRTSRESFHRQLVYGVITGVLPSASASNSAWAIFGTL